MSDSPAMRLIRLFYQEQGHGMGRSRERFNAGMREVVRLAIRYGLRFDIGDFAAIAKGRESYYFTGMYLAGEEEYALACGSQRGRFNQSAAKSWEAWRKRKPFLIRDPEQKTATRIYVGREFWWFGDFVTCTSIVDDKGSLIACTYKQTPDGWHSRKIEKRITITHAEIKRYHETLGKKQEAIAPRRAGDGA